MATTKAKKTWYFVLGMLPVYGGFTSAQTDGRVFDGFVVGALLAGVLLALTWLLAAHW